MVEAEGVSHHSRQTHTITSVFIVYMTEDAAECKEKGF